RRERSYDTQHLPSLVEEVSCHGKVFKVLTDAAYDSKNNFSYTYNNDIVPGIKVPDKHIIKWYIITSYNCKSHEIKAPQDSLGEVFNQFSSSHNSVKKVLKLALEGFCSLSLVPSFKT
ncbi:MAG: hypothetical protein KGH85_08990, partial [Thaumarchaeota archaeon]|nr:hypothetical protein [Nitrososphaerota archaeon]